MYSKIVNELFSTIDNVKKDDGFGDIEKKQVTQGLMIAIMMIQDIEEEAKVYHPHTSFYEVLKEYDGYLDKEDMRDIVRFAYEPDYAHKIDNMVEHKHAYDLLSMIYQNHYTVTNDIKDEVEELLGDDNYEG